MSQFQSKKNKMDPGADRIDDEECIVVNAKRVDSVKCVDEE